MKALQITKYGDLKDSLKIAEVDIPKISDSEILIAVKALLLPGTIFRYEELTQKIAIKISAFLLVFFRNTKKELNV